MPATGLSGPYPLTDAQINAHVGNSPGTYTLGSLDASNGTFLVSYVGRSGDKLNGRLHDWLGKYNQFKYGHYTTSEDAFRKECQIYHDFNPPGNSIHPARPVGSRCSCPVTGCRVLT